MIQFTTGNLLEAPTEAVVNTVNEVGVMGKGIALMFRESFPENTKTYQKACKRGEVRVGHMLVTRNHALVGPRWIINFPTKRHWRHPSRLEWVREGLKDLLRVLRVNEIRSVALPPLGCGAGKLEWQQVRREIEGVLGDLPDVEVLVYEPTTRYQNVPKQRGVEKLTPARALIAEMVRRYSVLGIECSNLEVQKLAWFLHRVIRALRVKDPLRLRFGADMYGPYADNLRHLLDALDGSYLHSEKRLADAGPFDKIWFEEAKREAVESYLRSPAASVYREALDRTADLIDGFESPLGMELLATVDWLVTDRRCELKVPAIRCCLAEWPGGTAAARRKEALFDERLLGLAVERLSMSPPIAEPLVH